MPENPRDIVEIDIFDQRYPLRFSEPVDHEEILRLAKDVDLRMREIAHQTRTVDSLKIAILTALHLAQEKKEETASGKQLEAAVRSGSAKWIDRIDDAL